MHFTKDCVIILMLAGCYTVRVMTLPLWLASGAVYLYIYLTNLWELYIIHLTRQPEGECTSPDPANLNRTKNSRQLTREDGYFLCLVTSVMTAHNMMTKVNKSEYVTIQTTPFHKTGLGWSTSSGCLGKCIILSMLNVFYIYIMMIVSNCGWKIRAYGI